MSKSKYRCAALDAATLKAIPNQLADEVAELQTDTDNWQLDLAPLVADKTVSKDFLSEDDAMLADIIEAYMESQTPKPAKPAAAAQIDVAVINARIKALQVVAKFGKPDDRQTAEKRLKAYEIVLRRANKQ